MTENTLHARVLPAFDPRGLGLIPPAPPTRPNLTLVDEGPAYRLRAKIHALAPHELRVRVGEGFLEVEGHHRSTWRPLFCFGEAARRDLDFERRFPTPGVDVAAARARFIDGELEVQLPKRLGPGGLQATRELELDRPGRDDRAA